MSLKEMTKITQEVVSKFDNPNWSPETWALDLVEEVGELCNAILIRQGHKHVKRARADLANSLCDILFDLLMLSAVYNMDLEEEYQQMIVELEERMKHKEFSD